MADINYFALYPNGEVSALHIGDADDDEIFNKLLKVFKTKAGQNYDNYQCATMCTFSADEVSMVADCKDATKFVKSFASSLDGFGFEIFVCWHEHSKALYNVGVYQKNLFVSGKGFDDVYGPIVLRAQTLREDVAVEVAVSSALFMAEIIVKAKGNPIDSIFNKK